MTGTYKCVRRSAKWLIGLALLSVASHSALAQQQAAPEANAPEEERWEVRVYRVTDLILPRPDYPYRSEIPTTGQSFQPMPAAFSGGFGGGGFGGGGFGGGFGGQGGFGGGFSQISDDSSGQSPEGFGGGFSPFGGRETRESARLRFSMDDLIEAIQMTIDPSSWQDIGGEGVCKSLGGLLLVKQTPAVHRQIEHLLTSIRQEGGTVQAVTLEAYWMLLGSDDLARLAPEAGNADRGGPAPVDRKVLKQLADSDTGYRGRITCFSDQTVHLVSGRRTTAVVSGVPSVGQHAVGYTPIISVPNIGVLLQVRPTLLPDKPAAVVNLESTVTSLAGGQPNPIRSATAAAKGEGAPGASAPAALELELDRLTIDTHHLATTVRLPLGQPVLVGGLSTTGGDRPAGEAAGPRKQLYLVVELMVAGDAGP